MGKSNKKFDKESYSEKLKDPRWQKKRLEILQRDEWKCKNCGDDESSLHVHHLRYKSSDPWSVSNRDLITLCESCHERESIERFPVEKQLLKELRKTGLTVEELEEIVDHFSRANRYLDALESEEWRAREKMLTEKALLEDNYVCSRCHNDGGSLVVYHKYLYSSKDPVSLSDNDFQFLCKKCFGRNHLSWEWELVLLKTMRESGWLSDDLLELAQGIFHCKPIQLMEVFVSMLRLLLEDQQFQFIVDGEYFKYLSLLDKKREAERTAKEMKNEN